MPSSGAASATSHSTLPVDGSSTGRVAPDFAGRHDPPMNSPVGTCSSTRASSLEFLVMAAIVPSRPARRTPRAAPSRRAAADVAGWVGDRRRRACPSWCRRRPSCPPRVAALRAEVRAFLAAERAAGAWTPRADVWLSGWDERFSAELGRRGWLGMTIPVEYGGRGASPLDRYVVTEELLAAGAPVAAHWIADRQIAPTLLRFGTEAQRRRYLPGIAAGTVFFGIGMSEPDAGSDLAAVRTRADRVDGGWELTGTKVWTSGAHHAHAFFALARSAPRDEAQPARRAEPVHRRAGLARRADPARSRC